MTAEADDINQQRTLLKNLLQRIPDSIRNGSYNASHDYKKHAVAALALLNKKTAKLYDLVLAVRRFQDYHRPPAALITPPTTTP